MAETQIFGEAPVFVVAFEKRGVIFVNHQLCIGDLLEGSHQRRRGSGMEEG